MTAETFYANSCTKLCIDVFRAANTFKEFNSIFSLSFYVLTPMNNAKQKCYFFFLYSFAISFYSSYVNFAESRIGDGKNLRYTVIMSRTVIP